MCLCGDWDGDLVEERIRIRKERERVRDSGAFGGIAEPRAGLPPGLAPGIGPRGFSPEMGSGMGFHHPPPPPSWHNGGDRSRHGGRSRSASRHGEGSHHGGGSRSRSRHGGGRGVRPDTLWGGSANTRGGPPPTNGGAWMHGARNPRGMSSRGRKPPPDYTAHAPGMETVRGPMPPGMRMGGGPGSRRSSRSGL
ncbi:hypothetical protein MMC08_007112 [Hypocenomyce scalaris]|nr:hypothetical protein [Hypocenomyce scalaris]